VELAHKNPVSLRMFSGLLNTHFNNAGWNAFQDQRVGYVGWMGLGGSVMQWHQGCEIGFGYAMNLLEATPTNERALNLQLVALKCAKEQQRVLDEEQEKLFYKQRSPQTKKKQLQLQPQTHKSQPQEDGADDKVPLTEEEPLEVQVQ